MKTKICSIFGLVAFVIAPLFAGAEEVNLPRPDPAVAEFARGVKFTVAGYTGTEVLTNFPVLVRIAERPEGGTTGIDGFKYSDFYNADGSDICFVDMEGNGLAYDIDEWNTNGESLVWVSLPKMTNNAEFVMWYRSSKTGKDVNSTNVWANYAGVWHFGENYGTETGPVSVYDSTTNDLTGTTYWVSGISQSASVTGAKVGRSRKIASRNENNVKDKGCITVSLGQSGSAKRAAVDKLTEGSFCASFWMKPLQNGRYEYFVSRKNAESYPAWCLQNNQQNFTDSFRVWSNGVGKDGNDTAKASINGAGLGNGKWSKIDVVWRSDTKYDFYINGVAKATGAALTPGNAASGELDLTIGGSIGGRPFVGEMDEFRLSYFAPSPDWVRADCETVTNLAFLSVGSVVVVEIVERPVVTFALKDYGASHAHFSGVLASLGGAGATEGTFSAKVWKTASESEETAEWQTLALGLAVGSFEAKVKGLAPQTGYSYALKIVNDEGENGVESDIVRGDFTTTGTGVAGSGGTISRVGDDWLHTFKILGGVSSYTFVSPSYASSVRALVVAGGGPGGYNAGGGGGAGGFIDNLALPVTPNASYIVTVGAGGSAATSDSAPGSNGGDSLIATSAGVDVVRAIGGGAGGNGSGSYTNGANGGSGGAGALAESTAGTGKSDQGRSGGIGVTTEKYGKLAGGGGGASGAGGTPPPVGNSINAGAGGTGLESNISGTSVFYAGGGGGGGTLDKKETYPGNAGNGGGGRGGKKNSEQAGLENAESGTDGLGGGGGGGSDATGYKQGGNGGNGIVMIRYPANGNAADIPQPIVSLKSAVYNADGFAVDFTYRVAWAGNGYNDAEVSVIWGFSPNSLVYTNDTWTSGVIGLGEGSVKMKYDQHMVYLRAIARNAGGQYGVSEEIESLYIPDSTQGTGVTFPAVDSVSTANITAKTVDVTGTVTSIGLSEETVRVIVSVGLEEDDLSVVGEVRCALNGTFTLPVTRLAALTTYYYKVEVVDDEGLADETSVQTFTTARPAGVLFLIY